VEVPAGRGAVPGTYGEPPSQRGGLAIRAAGFYQPAGKRLYHYDAGHRIRGRLRAAPFLCLDGAA